MKYDRSDELRRRAHNILPGGAHTYAKGDDQYPILSPGFIARGLNGHVWDVDGNEYIEFGLGNRAVGLGHCYPSIIDAVSKTLALGVNFTRPAEIEVACAEAFLDMIEGAEMVKFCKDGSDATSGAVRLARAYTGRDLVGYCADHPFFSVDDWFIGTTAMADGIPEATRKLSVGFKYGDLESARALFRDHPGQVACLILEAARLQDPPTGYLQSLRNLCEAEGALFILDEMITGFRWHNGGAQTLYGVEPHLSCFGKALGNGFSVSALAGKREYMRLGGLEHTDKPRVFLLSTTHGAETHSLAAAMATMRVYREEPVIDTLMARGEALRQGFQQVIRHHGLQDHVSVSGRSSCLVFGTLDNDRKPSQAFRSLFLQETIRRGVLMPSLVVCYTHTPQDIERTLDAVDGALVVYKRALTDGAEPHLVGRPSKMVYRRFN